MSSRLLHFWYQQNNPLRYLLFPFHLLFLFIIKIRRYLYQWGIFYSKKVNCPVIIIGNITVGGTGKSPLVIHLAEFLTDAGLKVGIVSRGYGGDSETYPLEVTDDSLPAVVGDEPVMIKAQTRARVVVDPKRNRGAEYLVEQCACNLIICDDGLQHYALERDVEIIVIDGQRKLGNGLVIPCGPLREPPSRIKDSDAVVINSSGNDEETQLPLLASINNIKQFQMVLENNCFVSLGDAKTQELNTFINRCHKSNKPIHSIAGIGNPQRFHDQLQRLGLNSINHSFNDHHSYSIDDFNELDGIIIMTEKDAVKCRHLKFADNVARENIWYLKVTAKVDPSIGDYCVKLLDQLMPHQRKREH